MIYSCLLEAHVSRFRLPHSFLEHRMARGFPIGSKASIITGFSGVPVRPLHIPIFPREPTASAFEPLILVIPNLLPKRLSILGKGPSYIRLGGFVSSAYWLCSGAAYSPIPSISGESECVLQRCSKKEEDSRGRCTMTCFRAAQAYLCC